MLQDLWSNVWSWYLDNSLYFWLWLVIGSVFIALFRMSWSALAGFDVAWDEDRFHQKHRRSDWNKASTRRYSWWGLGVPLFLIWVCGVLLQVQAGFDFRLYFALATIWLITTPLRNFWLVAIVRRADAKRGLPHDGSLLEEVTRYYEAAFFRPNRDEIEPWFDGRLKFLNVFQKVRLIWYIFNIWGILGLLWQMVISLGWPISAGVAIFYYMHEAEDYAGRRAWWRFTRR